MRHKSSTIKASVLFALAFVLIGLQLRYDLSGRIDSATLTGWLETAGLWAPIVFILAMATAVVVSPLPSLPLDILAGSFFGPFWGALYAIVGATLGAVASFFLARVLGRELLARFLKGHINFCRRCSDKLLARVVFFSRLIPFVSFDLVSYGAGLTNMSAGKFTLATILGMIPLTILYTTYGATALSSPATAWIGGAVMVVLFFLLPRWIERYDVFSMRRHFQHDADRMDPVSAHPDKTKQGATRRGSRRM